MILCATSAWGQCIDFYDLDAAYVKCEIGPYAARTGGASWTEQKVDYGYDKPASRHTVHRSTAEIDTVTMLNGTNPGLHTIPAGEVASVRLGNRLDGIDVAALYNDCSNQNNYTGEAERITYTLHVTDENKYILLRYAIIWENPGGHNDLLPSFQIETLSGETGETPIAGECYNFSSTVGEADFDYIGKSTLNHRICSGNNWSGWGSKLQTEEHDVAWRKWRTRIVNLEDYVGQTIRLRITSSDCGHRGHFGYSYFTLRCLDVNLYSPTCGLPTDTRTFTAPEGLNYIWYKVNSAHVRLETLTENSNALTVLNDGQEYECYIASPENANCHISLYATAAPRAPIADFAVDLHKACVDTVYLIDKSGVSYDGTTVAYPRENVDEVRWDYGDGVRTNAIYTPGQPITYAQDGTYIITQTAKLGPGNCESTMFWPVTVRGYSATHDGEVYDTICNGDSYIWNSGTYIHTGVYSYVMSNAAAGGRCDSVARLHLKVWDSYIFPTDTIDVREGKETPYVWKKNGHSVNLFTSGVYIDSCLSVHGCDSIHRLVLRVRPKHYIHEFDTICKGESYKYHKNGVTVYYTETGIYYDSLLTETYGNDSVYCLELFVRPSYHYSETQTFCKGDTVTFHGERFWTDGPHTVHFTSRHGCDSSYTVVLQQLNPSLKDTAATVTDQQLPFRWRGRYDCMHTGMYYDSLTAANGCDSITRLLLTVKPTYFFTETPVTVCEGTAYNFHDTILTTSGIYQRRYKSIVYGTDSVYQIVFTVKPTYDETTIYADIAEGDEYDFFGTKYTAGGVYRYTFPENMRRCDSTVTLVLTTRPKYFFLIRDTICEGETYHFHRNGADRPLTEGGVYWDSCQTVHGYDSIYRLDLKVNRSYHITEAFTICQGDTLHRHGQSFYDPNTYTVPFITKDGCDSIFTLTLTVNPRYETTIYRTICEGEYVIFDGQSRSVGGFYTEHRTTAKGCDSITHLNLTVLPKTRITIDRHLCAGEYFDFHGQHITTGCTVSDTVNGSNGCDSITIYNVYFHPVVRDTVRKTICEGETYDFHGHVYSSSGTYALTAQSRYHCDSTHVLVLTVNPKYETHITEKRALGDHYYFFGQDITSGGVYTCNTTTIHGCDSIVRLAISFYPTYLIKDTVYICNGDGYTYHKNGTTVTYTSPGIYWDSLKTVHGYDSVYKLDLRTYRSYYMSEADTICQGDTLYRHGQSFYEQKVYTIPFTTKDGCDSIFTLTLTVNPRYETTIYKTICEGDYVMFGGQSRTKGGIYSDTLKTKLGCDSITHLNLTVNPKLRRDEDIHLCGGDFFNFKGKHITTSGVYIDTLQTALTGCDSIHAYHVYVHPVMRDTTRVSICQGEHYHFHGNTFSTVGIHEVQGQSVYGCDSTYVLDLRVNPVYRSDTTLTLCHGNTISVFGRLYDHGGVYRDTLTSVAGCDSIYTIHINEYAKFHNVAHHSLCQGDTLLWRGKEITKAGVYYDSLVSQLNGCDSVYQMTVNTRNTYYTVLEKTILSVDYYDFNGTVLRTSGTYYHHFISEQNGCDSLVELRLTVLPVYELNETHEMCDGETYIWNGLHLTETGDYTVTLKSQHNTDSIVHLGLTVYKSIVHELPVVHISDRETYTWHGTTYNATGSYTYDTISLVTGCDSVAKLRLVVHPTYRFDDYDTICNNQYYTWNKNGNSYNLPGEYIYNPGTAVWNYDSVYVLHLATRPTYVRHESAVVCEGSYYNFHGRPLSEGGYYVDTIPTLKGGCDSITHLTLTKQAVSYVTETQTICPGDYWEWHGRLLSAQNIYFDTLRYAGSGCDSVRFAFQLKVNKRFYEEQEAVTCANHPFTWRGRSLNKSGIYYDSLQSVYYPYCDSVYCLKLTVKPIFDSVIIDTICEGDYYPFGGLYLTEGGVYRQTYTAVNGCDSAVELRLTKKPVTRIQIRRDLCAGEVFTFHGIDYNVDGTYSDTTLSVLIGCDSITTYDVRFHPVVRDTLEAETCEGTPFYYYGHEFYSSGWYTVGGSSEYGCDSVHVLHLQVLGVERRDTSVTICTGESRTLFGKVYSRSGTYRDTLYYRLGCDSVIYTIHVDEDAHESVVTSLSLCKGDYTDWRGRHITTAGVYRDTVWHTTGCFDTYELRVQVRQPAYREIEATIPSTTYYDFNGRIVRDDSVYYDTIPNGARNGCDSVTRLRLHVDPVYYTNEKASICVGETYNFHGSVLDAAGYYEVKLHPSPGVDSTVTLSLTAYSPIIHETVVHISDQEQYAWKGHLLHLSGTYDSVYTSLVTGCDSIERLRLQVHNTYQFETRLSACETEPVTWRRYQGLTKSGTYYDSLHTEIWNYDSVYVLHLEVNPYYRKDTTVHMCAGDYYEFGGEARYNGGYYTQLLNTHKGCDSLLTLTLLKHPSHLIEERKTICGGDVYVWHGRELTESGVYDDSLLTAFGCDSVHRLILNVHKSFYRETEVDMCEGDYYDFHGRQLNETGVYWDSLVTPMHRCDSVYKLTLRVHQPCRTELYDTICGSGYVLFGGRSLYEGGRYVDSLVTEHGCDSIVTLHLMHYPVSFTRVTVDLCRGEEYAWTENGGRAVSLAASGVYRDTLTAANGRCDSIVELRLGVYNTYYTELYQAICSNGYYDFHGRPLNETGVYWDSLRTIHTGCDSVYKLNLTVHPAYAFDTTVYVCDWEPFYFAGERIRQTGTYYERLTTRMGCDSVSTLHAYVQASRRDSTVEQLCLGDTLDFYGRQLTTSGIYRDTLADPQTRQCVITVVNLGFVAKSYLDFVRVDEACADDGWFTIHTNYLGARPTAYSLLFDEAAHAAGFEDILDAPYSEPIEAPLPPRDSGLYVRPDYYHGWLKIDNQVCVPDSLSTVPVTLLLRYPSWLIEQNWNDVVALLNEQYNGGYRFATYEWLVNSNPVGQNGSYLYLPTTLGTGDEVSVLLTREGETYAVPTCPIVVYDMSSELLNDYPVLAHPTGMPGQIRLCAYADGGYRLYTATGQCIGAGSFADGESLILSTHGTEACYILRLTTASHGVRTMKMIVR